MLVSSGLPMSQLQLLTTIRQSRKFNISALITFDIYIV